MYLCLSMTVGNRLSDMEFDEISLVTRPANQLSKVVLFKSDTEHTEQSMSENEVIESEETTIEESNDADIEVDKGMGYGKGRKNMPKMEMEDEEEDDMEKGKKMKKDDATELPAEVFEYIEALEAANAELTDQIEKMAQEEASAQEDILKSADPQIVAIVKAAEERAAAAEQIAKSERDFRLQREFVSKAAGMPHVAGDAEAFGTVLKTVAEAVDANTFDALMSALTSANESIDSGNLFAELGKSSSFDNDGPSSEINKAAARLIEENPSLTREMAVAKAVEANPSLYTEYLRGN